MIDCKNDDAEDGALSLTDGPLLEAFSASSSDIEMVTFFEFFITARLFRAAIW